jgi:two-component system CitB family sensor kinase
VLVAGRSIRALRAAEIVVRVLLITLAAERGGVQVAAVHTRRVGRLRPKAARRRRRTLSAQLLAGQLVVLLIATAVGAALWARGLRGELDHQYQQRALAVAAATAAMPQIVSALEHRDPHGVQSLAEAIRRSSHASYVVVIDRSGIRYSHPEPALIGRTIEEPVAALDGRDHVGIDHGSLGRSANGKAPVRTADGRIVGEVSAGVLETSVSAEARNELLGLAVYLPLVLAAGLLVALMLARRLKRQTFGLELDEIAALVHEREATLHGIREGVLAVDRHGTLTLLNDQAHQLLGTAPPDVGRPAADVLADSDVRRLLPATDDAQDITDLVTLHRGRLLVGSRRRVTEAGRDLGYVVTLRDRTELDQALRELDETRSFTDTLRAQQHEFSNRMHVLAGLLDLGRFDEAAGYAREVDGASASLAAELEAEINDPRIAALLVAKTTVARERGVALRVECAAPITIDEASSDALVSIIGNLVDNAIDAATEAGRPEGVVPAVVVRLAGEADDLVIDVADTGPGIPRGAEEAIFTGGWSTKDSGARSRGIGLALVRQLVGTLAGTVQVRPGAGARFRVTVPRVHSEDRP